MLQSNLARQGVDIAIDGNLVYADVTNRRVGVNVSLPDSTLHVNGSAHLGNIVFTNNVVTSTTGVIDFGSNANVKITGGGSNYILATNGSGTLRWSSIGEIANTGGILGNVINLGTNASGVFVSNAVALTTSTTVTNGIAQMNEVLGKLVPPPPAAFPGAQTLTISSTSTQGGRMCNFTQTDNTASGGKNIAGGTTSTYILRTSAYTTNTIGDCGPGTSGTVAAYLNGVLAGSKTLAWGVDNGTYGNLVIADNVDYSVKTGDRGGFWESFDSYAAGTVSSGWNEVYITHSSAASTNTPYWYYDASTPGTPAFSNTSITLTTNVVSYSSTVPHFTSSTQFKLKGNVAKLSGDMYYSSDTFITGSAAGAFQAPASVTYTQAGVTTPLARNLYVSTGSAYFETTSNVTTSGFGLSSAGPTLSAYNSYATGSNTFVPGVTVLYKNGTSTQIEETSIPVSVSLGSGFSTNGSRIILTTNSNTPAYTGSESIFSSQTTPLQLYDATVVAAVLKHDQTNYSTGYLPVGPNLSANRAGTQYFTFVFQRTVVSKFDITYTGTLAGLWVALPGAATDLTSSLNGWLDVSTAYAGSGIPGANTSFGGNGSNGCALAGTAVLNSAQTNKAVTATFGTISSSSTASNKIYVRVALTAGQSLTALSIGVATH